MQIIIDLAHDSIDVVQAVFAAYHANTPRMPLALGDDTLEPAAAMRSTAVAASLDAHVAAQIREDAAQAAAVAAPPAEAKPKRGRKPAAVATPEVPADPVIPPPPAPAAETYEEFLKWISGQLMANTLDAGKLEAARKSVGAETLFELSQKPELIPQMRKALES